MASRTIYTCDRCSKEQSTHRQMWWVGAYISSCDYGNAEISRPTITQQWCRSCAVETGFIIIPKPNKIVDPAPSTTLEQQLRLVIGAIALEEVGGLAAPSGDA